MQDPLDQGITPPPYVLQNQREREQLLSHWGVVSPLQRALFLELTESWTPSIDFKAFTGARSEGGVNLSSDLETLMAKARAAQSGLILTQKDMDGQRHPHRIILTAPGDRRFWYYHLSEWFQTNADAPENPFITENLVLQQDHSLPQGLLTPLALSGLTKQKLDEGIASRDIFRIPVFGNDFLIIPARDLTRLLAFASAKLRATLSSSEIAAGVAKIMNTSLVELQKRVASKEALFWKGLCQAVYDHNADLLGDRKLRLTPDFIQGAEVFLAFLNNQLEESRRQKEEGKEREQDLRQVEAVIKAAAEAPLTPQEVDKHLAVYLPKYGDKYPLFREDFFKLYTILDQKTGLPPVVPLGQTYVHRDNLYALILRRTDRLGFKLKEELSLRMDYILRTNNRNNDLTFSSPESLEAACQDFLAEKDPWLAEVFKKGRNVAESLIHHGKIQLRAKTIDELKPLMERWFKNNSTTLKSLVFLLDLDSYELYEQAQKRLSLFAQLMLLLSGRQNQYREKFLLLSPKAHDKPARGSLPPSERVSPSYTVRGVGSSSSAGRSESGRKGRTASPPPAPKPKVYTKSEREAAWSRFKDNIQK